MEGEFDSTIFEKNILDDARQVEEDVTDVAVEQEKAPDDDKHVKGVSNDANDDDSKEPAKEEQRSPNDASSIAKALKQAGILTTLDDDAIDKISNLSDIGGLFDNEVNNRLTAQQKRVLEALEYNVEKPVIKAYEDQISTIENKYSDSVLTNEENENARCSIIYANLLTKGISKEDAKEIVESYVEKGTDVKKAIEAKKEYLEKLKNEYNSVINEEKKKKKKIDDENTDFINKLKESILNDNGLFSDLNISNTVREKIFNTLVNPIENKNGKNVTEIEKYIGDHSIDANKWIGMFYVLTDGFKNMSKLFDGPIKKGVKSRFEDVTRALENSNIRAENDMTYKSGVSDDIFKDIDLGNFELA